MILSVISENTISKILSEARILSSFYTYYNTLDKGVLWVFIDLKLLNIISSYYITCY